MGRLIPVIDQLQRAISRVKRLIRLSIDSRSA